MDGREKVRFGLGGFVGGGSGRGVREGGAEEAVASRGVGEAKRVRPSPWSPVCS